MININLQKNVTIHKRNTRVAVASGNMRRTNLPVLRLAFDKIINRRGRTPLQSLAILMKNTGSMQMKDSLNHMYRSVAARMYRIRLEQGLQGINKRPLIIDGCLKLANLVCLR
jgi:hypothetical protein